MVDEKEPPGKPGIAIYLFYQNSQKGLWLGQNVVGALTMTHVGVCFFPFFPLWRGINFGGGLSPCPLLAERFPRHGFLLPQKYFASAASAHGLCGISVGLSWGGLRVPARQFAESLSFLARRSSERSSKSLLILHS